MIRKAVYAAVSWGAGLWGCILFQSYWFLLFAALALFCTASVFIFKWKLKQIAVVSIAFLSAVSYYMIYDITTYKEIISKSGTECEFNGEILEIKELSNDRASYLVKGTLDGKSGVKLYLYSDDCDCDIGDNVYFKGEPKQFENDYLFDTKDHYRSKGIFLCCDNFSYLEIEQTAKFSFSRILKDYREDLKSFIGRNLPSDQSGLICGMLFGDKSRMTENDKTLFYRTGIGHVMAVSGLHLMIFCGIFNYILRKRRAGRIQKAMIISAVVLFFAVFSGMSVSILRASLMMLIGISAPLFFRKADTASSVSIAFILLTLPCPFAAADPSLMLSVVGALSAGCFAPYMTSAIKTDTRIKKIFKACAYTFFVSLGTAPVSAAFFGEFSLLSPIANILLIPVCMIILVLSLIVSVLFFIEPVFLIKITGMLADIVISAVRFVGKFSFAGISFGYGLGVAIVVSAIAVLFLFMIFKSCKAMLLLISSALSLLTVCGVLQSVISEGKLRIALLGDKDIDILVVTNSSKCCIIDLSGKAKNIDYCLRYLEDENIRTADSLYLTAAPYQAISIYDRGFELIETKKLTIPHDTILGNTDMLCGTVPILADINDISDTVGEADITLNNGSISIRYGDFSLICSNTSCGPADVIAEYDALFDTDLCRAVIAPKYDGITYDPSLIKNSNVVVTADKNGKFTVGGL